MDLSPLPAPLHLRPLRLQAVPTSVAQSELQAFLDDDTAKRVLSGAGASAMREALVRLVGGLKEEEGRVVSSMPKREKVKVKEGKKRKGVEAETADDKKKSKKHKKA